jgi:hypothetical protein
MKCSKHAGQPGLTNIGKCSHCHGPTTSGTDKLCSLCSQKLNECQVCRVKMLKDPSQPGKK